MTESKHKIRRVVAAAYSTVWAILPQKLNAICELLDLRANGAALSKEEVRARIGAQEEDSERPLFERPLDGRVALLRLHGVISQRMNMMSQVSGGVSTEQFTKAFRSAVVDQEITAIVIDVDSPGGSTPGVAELAEEIKSARGIKPIIAVSNSMMASAAYWIASAADKIVASPGSMLGSIGVFTMHSDLTGQDEKLGVKRTVVSAGRFKVASLDGETLAPEGKAELQALVDETFENFIMAVAENRATTAAHVESGFGQGKILAARDAVAEGLADEIGTLEDVLREFQVGAASRARMSSRAIWRGLAVDKKVLNALVERKLVAADSSEEQAQLVLSGFYAARGSQLPESTEQIVSDLAETVSQPAQPTANSNGKPAIIHDVEKLAAKAAVEAVSAERERVADITASCRALGISDQEQIDKFVGLEKSPELTKAALVDHLATAEQPVYSFATGEAAVDKFDTVCAQALELRLNGGALLDSKKHVSEGARVMSTGSLLEMARESLRMGGVRIAGMSRKQVAVAALAMPTQWDIKADGGAYHTSGSFSNLALDASNKSLRIAYEDAPVTWRSWARQAASVPDFKNINRIQLSEAPDLEVTPEDTDYKETKLTDDRAFYSIENYGKVFSITFQMILNDDLDALDRLPRLHATAAARTVNKNVYGLLTDNVSMQDSNALFDSSNHSNIVSSGGTPTVAQLGEMRELLRLQTGASDGDGTGQILNLVMMHLIVPANLETAAEQLIASLVDPSKSNQTPNLRFIRGLNLVVEPLLDASDTGIYYGAASNSQIDTVEVSFLQGDETPQTETWWDFSRDVRKVRVRQAHAAKVIDWRGLNRNPGS